MANQWQLQEAKSKFSHIVEKACNEGPQFVTKHGDNAVVVISYDGILNCEISTRYLCIIRSVQKHSNPQVIDWLGSVDEQSIYLCVLTLGEIEKGVEKNKDPARRRKLRSWLEFDLKDRFYRL